MCISIKNVYLRKVGEKRASPPLQKVGEMFPCPPTDYAHGADTDGGMPETHFSEVGGTEID